MLNPYTRIFLASSSPRRKEILAAAGLRFSVFPIETNEKISCSRPEELVESLSSKKSHAAFEKLSSLYPQGNHIIISADTVVCVDKMILGKPRSDEDAAKMLEKLSGREHSVFTGVSLWSIKEGIPGNKICFHDETKVVFQALSKEEIEEYIATGEPVDKAGAYAIQGRGAGFVKEIFGNYHNVVGLPISKLLGEMRNHGFLEKLPKCRAAVFDLDGTIMDTLESLSYCSNKVLEGFRKPAIDIEKYKYFVGNGAGKLVERFLSYAGLDIKENFDTAFSAYMELFAKHKNYKVMVYEGLYSILTELKKRGIKLGVYTNKPDREARSILQNTFGYDMFDEIRGDINGQNLKPDPHAVLQWSEKWNIPTSEILYLGDTNTDMQTGNSAGAYTLGVSWGFRDRMELFEHGAYDVIDEPYWILNYI